MKRCLMFLLFAVTTFQLGCFLDGDNFPNNVVDDSPFPIIAAYYDLRDRDSYIQLTNIGQTSGRLHVQIFQQDNDCREINFFDDLTPNDTVVYDLDNIIRNNGTAVPANLDDNSYGFVVVSTIQLDGPSASLIGNFRIVDNAGYEYRSNMGALGFFPFEFLEEVAEFSDFQSMGGASLISEQVNNLYANFNTVDNARYADVVGFAYTIPTIFSEGFEAPDEDSLTVRNYSDGVAFDIFVFDMNEEPLSCDSTVFACGGVMNYGVNEDYVNSRSEDLLCPGGGLADPNGGFISFENGRFLNYTPPQLIVDGDGDTESEVLGPDIGEIIDVPLFVGLIGLNNGDGTGSMDFWFTDEGIEVDPPDPT